MTRREIPMLDLAAQVEALWPELEKTLHDLLRRGRFVGGPEVEQLESELARYLGVRFAVGLGSGTDALVIGLRALGVGPGDEVIVPSFTFFATAEAVSTLGATPVFADIEPAYFTLDVEAVRAAIGPRTRAIVPVHLFGHPADLEALRGLARQHELLLFEDAAQAIGASRGGLRAGACGHAAAFSFYPSKNLGAFGDAGLLATDDPEVAKRARSLGNHGSRGGYVHDELGYCSRLDALQAAVLRLKLPYLERWNAARREIAAAYCEQLSGVPGVVLPGTAADATHVFHQFTLRCEPRRRDSLREALGRAGVGAVVYYPQPIHRMEPYAARALPLPETERACREVLSLPIYPELDPDRVAQITSAVRSALG